MRGLKRNMRTIWYASYIGNAPVTDSDGEETTETYPTFSDPVSLQCNISGGTGTWQSQPFGPYAEYDRTISIVGEDPLHEGDRLWVGISTDKRYNYIVTSVCNGLTCHLIGIKGVPQNGD